VPPSAPIAIHGRLSRNTNVGAAPVIRLFPRAIGLRVNGLFAMVDHPLLVVRKRGEPLL